jgi:hypothetical protein
LDVPYLTIRPNDPCADAVGRDSVHGSIKMAGDLWPVILMVQGGDSAYGRRELMPRNAGNTVVFIRPSNGAARKGQIPTANVSQLLCLCQMVLTPL